MKTLKFIAILFATFVALGFSSVNATESSQAPAGPTVKLPPLVVNGSQVWSYVRVADADLNVEVFSMFDKVTTRQEVYSALYQIRRFDVLVPVNLQCRPDQPVVFVLVTPALMDKLGVPRSDGKPRQLVSFASGKKIIELEYVDGAWPDFMPAFIANTLWYRSPKLPIWFQVSMLDLMHAYQFDASVGVASWPSDSHRKWLPLIPMDEFFKGPFVEENKARGALWRCQEVLFSEWAVTFIGTGLKERANLWKFVDECSRHPDADTETLFRQCFGIGYGGSHGVESALSDFRDWMVGRSIRWYGVDPTVPSFEVMEAKSEDVARVHENMALLQAEQVSQSP